MEKRNDSGRMEKILKKIISVIIMVGMCFVCVASAKEKSQEVKATSIFAVGQVPKIAACTVSEEDGTESVEDTQNDIRQMPWQECDLPYDEMPDYYYFTNACQGHYNLSLENEVASVIKDYTLDIGKGNEEWELKRICSSEGFWQAFVESEAGNELYILLKKEGNTQYIIAADIHTDSEAEILLQDGRYSYDSVLEWHSYEQRLNDGKEMEERIRFDSGDLYDSIYVNGSYYALYDYLNGAGGDIKQDWKIDCNASYIGRNGYIASICLVGGDERINMLVDVWNKVYTVLK